MNWEFTANTSEELAKIGNALFGATKQNVLDEQVQMTRLLGSLARTDLLNYPLSVRHTGIQAVPDFQLLFGKARIAVEITKVAVSDVEHARSLQQKGIKRTLAISSLYRKETRARRKSEVIAEGFGTPAFVFPVSLDEHDRIWFEEAEVALQAKKFPKDIDGFNLGIHEIPPQMGVCSTAAIEGGRVYSVSHRFEVVCLGANGTLYLATSGGWLWAVQQSK